MMMIDKERFAASIVPCYAPDASADSRVRPYCRGLKVVGAILDRVLVVV